MGCAYTNEMSNSAPRRLARDDVPSRFQAGPEILQLLGDGVRVLHPMPGERTDTRGGDVECAVSRLDRCWPLRVPTGYRVVQSIHYDIFGWAWVLEHNGAFAIVDAIEDPAGINRLGFPTSLADADGEVASPASRAVYLTAKRVWKRQLDVMHWQEIRNLSALGDHEFLSKLTTVFGRAVAGRLQQTIRSGEPPDRRLWLAARSLQLLRRLDTPRKLLTLAWGGSSRVAERLIHPTGFCALLLDPDGLGDFPREALARSLQGPLMRHASIERRKGGSSRNGRRGVATSLLMLSREWLGFLLWSSLPIWRSRAAKGLIVIDGGWWESLMLEGLDIRARRLASDVLAPSPTEARRRPGSRWKYEGPRRASVFAGSSTSVEVRCYASGEAGSADEGVRPEGPSNSRISGVLSVRHRVDEASDDGPPVYLAARARARGRERPSTPSTLYRQLAKVADCSSSGDLRRLPSPPSGGASAQSRPRGGCRVPPRAQHPFGRSVERTGPVCRGRLGRDRKRPVGGEGLYERPRSRCA
jgi:hypothetical protein